MWQRPTSYAAIGATQAVDLMRYPPNGYRPVERRARIGHGDARFDWAAMQALSWGVQRHAGLRVRLIDSPIEVTELSYTPVSFDESGAPIAPEQTEIEGEVVFGQDGTPFAAPGDTALLGVALGIRFPVRVIYVVNEPKRKGFAYGTLYGHPASGEEALVVEQKDDGSVWMTLRAFSRPANWFWWFSYPVFRIVEDIYNRRYLRALAVPIE
jgi:uncharacterized protein (UPF0548 family)